MRQVALRGLRARPLRTLLTAMSVVLGVAMIAGTYVLTDTINKSFSEVFAQANSGTDVVVSPKKVDDAFSDSDPPPISDALVKRVRAVDGVRAAAGGVQGDISIRNARGDRVGRFDLVLSTLPAPLDPFRYVAGRAPRAADEIALSAKAFKDEGFKLGDRVNVVGDEGAKRYRLVGSARFGDVDTVGGYPAGIVTLPTAQALTGNPGKISSIAVAAGRGVTPAALRDRVRLALAGQEVEVLPASRRPPSRPPTSRRTSASCGRSCSSSPGSRCSSARSSSTTRSRSPSPSARASWRCCARSGPAAARCCARSCWRPPSSVSSPRCSGCSAAWRWRPPCAGC
jgi:putative ABC transport system permease protein